MAWRESYAHALKLDTRTSSTITRAKQNPETKKWTVEINHADADPCSLVMNHLVFSMGFADGTHKVPQIHEAVRIYAVLGTILTSSNVLCWDEYTYQ